MRLRPMILVTLAILAGSCSSGTAADVSPSASLVEPSPTSAPPTAVTTTTVEPDEQPAPTPPTYEVSVIADTDPAAATWREGCPVALDALRLVRVPFKGFDARDHVGELVVHGLTADDVGSVFVALFELGFPMERMDLIGVFDGDDDASMIANNTSGFNCRFVAGTGTWSNHASGLAIDVNPLLNPWVTNRGIFPPEAELFADRPLDVAGVINADDPIVSLFADIGWAWGGDWSQPDYQHFEFDLDG